MNRIARAGGLAAGFCGLVLLAGCSGSSEATVSGDVLVDGQPLKRGRIQFLPAAGTGAPAEAPVADGKYTLAVAPGEYKVKVSGDRVTGKVKMYETPDSPTVDKVEEAVDAAYNDRSDLRMTVQRGAQEKRWEVRGRK
jgi:hypothetical protein